MKPPRHTRRTTRETASHMLYSNQKDQREGGSR